MGGAVKKIASAATLGLSDADSSRYGEPVKHPI